MDWIVTNGADLIGHTIVILVFLGGFLTLRRQSQFERTKDIAIKQYDRSADSILRCTSLMELTRTRLWMLAISPFDRKAPLDTDTAARLEEIEKLRSDLFGYSIFIPPELTHLFDTVFGSFDSFLPAINSSIADEKDRANDNSSHAISKWRIAAREWHQNEWRKLQS